VIQVCCHPSKLHLCNLTEISPARLIDVCFMFIVLVIRHASTLYDCPIPYNLIGDQCLFFSRPFSPWGISEDWRDAYLNYFNAAEMCNIMGGGRLAEKIRNFEATNTFCLKVRGGCTPSLVSIPHVRP